MLDVLVREALAPGTLGQPDVPAPSGAGGLGLGVGGFGRRGDGLLRTPGGVGGGLLVRRRWDGRSGGSVLAAVEHVVELGDGIAAFDAYRHRAVREGSSHSRGFCVFRRFGE